MRPAAWTPPTQALVQIKQLVREREALIKELLRERNHLKALQQGKYATPLVVRLAKQRMRLLERHSLKIEAASVMPLLKSRTPSQARSPHVSARLRLYRSSDRAGRNQWFRDA
jgi:hypothetical protein